MPGEFEGSSGAGSSGDFDMSAAVSEVAAGLGFGGDDGSSNEVDDSGSDTGNSAGDRASAAPVGESAKRSEGQPADAVAKQQADAAGQQPTSPAPGPDDAPDLNTPPKTWRKEATTGWETLPEGVRAEIHKREGDMYKGLEQYKDGAQFGWEIAGFFKPYEQLMEQAGVAPQQILPGLLNSHAVLATGSIDQKLQVLDRIVKDYGIPLPNLLARLTGGALDDAGPYIDPQVKALQDKVDGLQSRLSQQDQVTAQAKQAEIRSTVQAFADDPANVYFGELADDIATLIRSGVTKDIKVAYEKAMWANPVTRAKEQARVAQAAESERTRKAEEAAAKARKATAANVRSTARSGGPTAAKSTSLDETLETAYKEILSRG